MNWHTHYTTTWAQSSMKLIILVNLKWNKWIFLLIDLTPQKYTWSIESSSSSKNLFFFYFEQLNTQNWKHWRGGKMLVLILILFFSSIWFEIYSNTNTDNIFAKLVEKVSKLDFNWHYILYFKTFSFFCPSVKPSCAQFFVVFVIVSFGKF